LFLLCIYSGQKIVLNRTDEYYFRRWDKDKRINVKDARESSPAYVKKETGKYNFDYEPICGYPELRWTGKCNFLGEGTPGYPVRNL